MDNGTVAINATRMLAVDAINKAQSGHTGICLGAAPMLVELYAHHINACKDDAEWINRDRFVLSAGHGAPMLYALLHLAGFGLTVDDLKSLRQFGSRTAGHPERGLTRGVDASTGPLGQGIGMAVGFAVAERFLSARFNKRDYPVFDHYTYALCGDGDLQEGVAQEALSFAGHNALNKLIILYDSNDIQLDGPTRNAYSDDCENKYEAMGFDYYRVADGSDVAAIRAAIEQAKKSDKPSFIEVKTVIGFGSPLAGKCDCHGAPLGDMTDALKAQLGWDRAAFDVPSAAYKYFEDTLTKRSAKAYSEWNALYEKYAAQYPQDAAELEKAVRGELDCAVDMDCSEGLSEATRITAGKILAELSKRNAALIGGSADLTKSTKAKGADGDFSPLNPTGRNINFGVREHAMGAIINGINLHGGARAFSGAFFVFSDYMKPAVRLAALMGVPSVFVFTHDSIAVGEDGPTHQPVEQLSGLRAMPNLDVYRPCDAREAVQCFKSAFKRTNAPSAIILTRQNLTVERRDCDGADRGGYIFKREQNALCVCIIASGSEVNTAVAAARLLEREGLGARVVSVPNLGEFDRQPEEYKRSVLPSRDITVATEAATGAEWYKYAAHVLGINRFGMSAPCDRLSEEYGFTASALARRIKEVIA